MHTPAPLPPGGFAPAPFNPATIAPICPPPAPHVVSEETIASKNDTDPDWSVDIGNNTVDDVYLLELTTKLAPKELLEGWSGNKCPTCNGSGEVPGVHNDERCQACGGTGDEYGKLSVTNNLPTDRNDCCKTACQYAKDTGMQQVCAGECYYRKHLGPDTRLVVDDNPQVMPEREVPMKRVTDAANERALEHQREGIETAFIHGTAGFHPPQPTATKKPVIAMPMPAPAPAAPLVFPVPGITPAKTEDKKRPVIVMPLGEELPPPEPKKPINARAKGIKGERNLIDLLQPFVDDLRKIYTLPPLVIQRNTLQSHLGGNDIHGFSTMSFEVKFCKLDYSESWWTQAVKQAKPRQVPILAYRKNRQPFRFKMTANILVAESTQLWSPATVTLNEDDFLAWFKLFYIEECKTEYAASQPKLPLA